MTAMPETLTPELLAQIRERGPVGYHCDHSDEPLGARTHHEWEYVDGEGLAFQHMPDVVSANSGVRDHLSPERQSRRCPRAVPVYDVDVPALVAELDRLNAAVDLLGRELQKSAVADTDHLRAIAEARTDERARCVTELRNYSSPRMEKAVPEYGSGKDSALSEVFHAAAVERAARILESGEETVSRSTPGEGP